MITIEGIEYPSHKEYFAKFPWKRMHNKRINTKTLLKAYSVPCLDCGLSWHPAAMTLDHIERDGYKTAEGKRRFPSDMLAYPPELYNAELAKCEAVCQNCHNIREMVRDGHITSKKWLQWYHLERKGALLI